VTVNTRTTKPTNLQQKRSAGIPCMRVYEASCSVEIGTRNGERVRFRVAYGTPKMNLGVRGHVRALVRRDMSRLGKRCQATALQDAPRHSFAAGIRASVVDCGGPPPLFPTLHSKLLIPSSPLSIPDANRAVASAPRCRVNRSSNKCPWRFSETQSRPGCSGCRREWR